MDRCVCATKRKIKNTKKRVNAALISCLPHRNKEKLNESIQDQANHNHFQLKHPSSYIDSSGHFNFVNQLKCHMVTVIPEDRHTDCNVCDVEISTLSSASEAYAIHPKETPYSPLLQLFRSSVQDACKPNITHFQETKSFCHYSTSSAEVFVEEISSTLQFSNTPLHQQPLWFESKPTGGESFLLRMTSKAAGSRGSVDDALQSYKERLRLHRKTHKKQKAKIKKYRKAKSSYHSSLQSYSLTIAGRRRQQCTQIGLLAQQYCLLEDNSMLDSVGVSTHSWASSIEWTWPDRMDLHCAGFTIFWQECRCSLSEQLNRTPLHLAVARDENCRVATPESASLLDNDPNQVGVLPTTEYENAELESYDCEDLASALLSEDTLDIAVGQRCWVMPAISSIKYRSTDRRYTYSTPKIFVEPQSNSSLLVESFETSTKKIVQWDSSLICRQNRNAMVFRVHNYHRQYVLKKMDLQVKGQLERQSKYNFSLQILPSDDYLK